MSHIKVRLAPATHIIQHIFLCLIQCLLWCLCIRLDDIGQCDSFLETIQVPWICTIQMDTCFTHLIVGHRSLPLQQRWTSWLVITATNRGSTR
jgi:hypothetical protein